MHPVFLDTNVYMGYAYTAPYEGHHQECCFLFDSSHFQRYTSLSVNQELNKKKADRRRLYRSTIKHCLSGGRLKEFSIKDFGKSEASHLLVIIADAHKKGSSEVEYIRNLERFFFARLMHCLEKRTCQPLIPISKDGYLKDDLILGGVHSGDERVLADFITWALDGRGCCFITGDGPLYALRSKVLRTVKERKTRDVAHLSIEHISSVANRFPGPTGPLSSRPS